MKEGKKETRAGKEASVLLRNRREKVSRRGNSVPYLKPWAQQVSDWRADGLETFKRVWPNKWGHTEN